MPLQFIKTKEDGYGDQTFYILFDKFPYEGRTIYYGFTYPSVSYQGRKGTKLLYEIFAHFKANPMIIKDFMKENTAGKEKFLRRIHKKISQIGFVSQSDHVHPDDIAEVVDDLKNYMLERFDEDA